jgi:glycosyltransferase involved in cell wall biosynthesis
VITVFRRISLLPRALFSVLTQTGDPGPTWELLILADGPHPRGEAMIREFLEREPIYQDQISYATLPHSPGCWGNVARRVGLLKARGRYTCFLGHDCLLRQNYLAAHAENIGDVAGGPSVLSVVDVHYWRTRDMRDHRRDLGREVYHGTLPKRGVRPQDWVVGDIDLTCIAFPTGEAVRSDLFGAGTATQYTADSLGFLALREHLPVRYRPGVVAAHF